MIPGSNSDHPSFKKSFGFALQGFRYTLATERNIRVMLGGAAFAVVMGLVLQLDLVSPEYHPRAGHAKDIAAAAVYVLSFLVAVVGVCVFANAVISKFM